LPLSIEEFEQLGEYSAVTGEAARTRIYSTLINSQSAMTQGELAKTLGLREQHVNRMLHELLKDGKVVRARGPGGKGGRLVVYWKAVVKAE